MKFTQIYLVTIITIGVMGFVIAAGAPVTHQFAGGDPASATQVNENFQELADRIDELPAASTFDYRDYQSNATTKTFATSGLCGDLETRAFTRVANGNNTDVSTYRVRTNAGAICQEHGFDYVATPTEFQLLSKVYYDGTGLVTETATDAYDETVVRRTSTMRLGVSFGSHSTITNTLVGQGGTASGGIVETNTLLAVEEVTVPANTYQNCLKIHTNRTSNGNGAFNRMSWICPGVGEVKRAQHELSNLGYRLWELTAIN